MQDDTEQQRRVSRWALPGSVGAHLAVVLLLIFGLPLPEPATVEEKPIAVDLVPPEKPEKPETKQPKPEKPPEPQKKAETPPPAEKQAPRPAPAPVLKPVFQFGEKDAGPKLSTEGNSAEEKPASPAAPSEPARSAASQPEALTGHAPGDAAPLPGAPKKQAPKPEQAKKQKAQDAAKSTQAKKLFSQKATGDAIATTTMANVPRGVRGGRLCVTELREQLQNGLPPYYPDLLPSSPLEEGVAVIDVPEAAFRVGGQWYDLSYRCEVDTNATRVLAFSYRVGALLPPSEWRRRGLPSG